MVRHYKKRLGPRPSGRPFIPGEKSPRRTITITFRVNPNEKRALTEYAKDTRRSIASVIRSAIAKYVAGIKVYAKKKTRAPKTNKELIEIRSGMYRTNVH